MRNIFFYCLLFFVMTACTSNKAPEIQEKAPAKYGSTMQVDTSVHSTKFSPAMVNNKRDFICGMPVTAGIADTAHYRGNIYGFCAKECKDEFLKTPQAYITQK